MMGTKKLRLLLLLSVLLAGCATQWVLEWQVPLSAVPARGVETLWIGQGGERVNRLWRDESGQARIEQFDLDGYAWGALTVASSNWTGAYGIHPGDDSVILLERVSESSQSYTLLRQQMDGAARRVPVQIPPLSEGLQLQIDRIVAVTLQDQLAMDVRVLDDREQTVERRVLLLSTTGEILGQHALSAHEHAWLLKVSRFCCGDDRTTSGG